MQVNLLESPLAMMRVTSTGRSISVEHRRIATSTSELEDDACHADRRELEPLLLMYECTCLEHVRNDSAAERFGISNVHCGYFMGKKRNETFLDRTFLQVILALGHHFQPGDD